MARQLKYSLIMHNFAPFFFKIFGNCWYWYFSLLVTYFIGRRPGRAGLFAIFSTQSNDFALGNPILQAIYSLSHPDFQSYLYLLAPISLVILNPIGFVFMEIGKQQEQAAGTNINNSKWVLVKSVIKGICTNAVIGKFIFFSLLHLYENLSKVFG